MKSEDCYIYWDDEEIPQEERKVYMQCRECHEKNQKGVIWRAELGYRNKVVCPCGKIIHQQGENE